MIDLTLNGAEHSVPAGSSLKDLIRELELTGEALSVLINRRMIPRQSWVRELQPQDRVDIVLSAPMNCVKRPGAYERGSNKNE
jgi:sulfur carrier protein